MISPCQTRQQPQPQTGHQQSGYTLKKAKQPHITGAGAEVVQVSGQGHPQHLLGPQTAEPGLQKAHRGPLAQQLSQGG
ncbi:hypothetical protein H663_006355 [Limnohabitans planktonicus II-D5]|uniref:Uncharacterized protein n=1 Tax=Limnohabitans planktonicus II-D5 TaxID=1293045 RepID=A0A2T7UG79_9BURK|nr:hypothetical protein H663_006355 [Limnohabitans planktonicus II-D5]